MTPAKSSHRQFRFGVQATRAGSLGAWLALARRAEELGYSTLFMPDHFRDQLAPLPALAAAAAATTRLRLGTLVLANDFRHPSVLARDAATLDLLSDGRLELGVGAGWSGVEYRRAGIAFRSPGERIARLAESVEVLDLLLRGGPVSYAGEHFQLDGLECRPPCVQQPRPPLLIAGGGRNVLRLAARAADIVGINLDLRSGRNLNPRTPEFGAEAVSAASESATDQRVAWVREAAGERFPNIELNVRVYICEMTAAGSAIADYAERIGVTAAQLRALPNVIAGEPVEVVEILRERRRRYGFTYVVVGAESMEAFAPVVSALAGA